MIKFEAYKTCKHERKLDFTCWSFGDEKHIEHFYCPECRRHWFKGEYYNPKQWEEYINAPEDQEEKKVLVVGNLDNTNELLLKSIEKLKELQLPGAQLVGAGAAGINLEEDFPYECAVCGLRSNKLEKISNNGRCFNCDSPLTDIEDEEEEI
jgi:predicted RNA-binding Zn-ribbon protein involved in translation (DUF1610 family)